MRLLIAGGGTGGHIFPALAVVQALRRRAVDAELVWIGGQRGLEASIVRDAGIPLRLLALRSLRTVKRDVHLVLDPLRLAVSLLQAIALLVRRRPAAIFTTGGYVAIPVVLAARLLRIPVLLWEGNLQPGRSSRAVAGLASAIAVSYADACRALGRRSSCFETGTPIRDLAGVDRATARLHLGIPEEVAMLLVFGGSQASQRLNDAVHGALPALVERCVVCHVTGDDGHAAAIAARDRLPEEVRARYRPEPFLRAEMADALAATDLVVGRAGSSTLAEATALGLPLVVVPYPHAGGHQAANASRVAASGAALLIPDEAFDGPALLAAAAVLDDAGRLNAMRVASRSLGRPGAAAAVADVLLALAEHRSLPDDGEIAARSIGRAA
jgi:UDP-N-acetylglucosamine--N-acetylmuramyl-(pentapeptide) pyrophosphoryl-undecaprenol N-acetylglucosamine transferase